MALHLCQFLSRVTVRGVSEFGESTDSNMIILGPETEPDDSSSNGQSPPRGDGGSGRNGSGQSPPQGDGSSRGNGSEGPDQGSRQPPSSGQCLVLSYSFHLKH